MYKDEPTRDERDDTAPHTESLPPHDKRPDARNRGEKGDPFGEITPQDDDGLPDRPAKYRVPS
jgi:hypothetical protein